MTYIESKCKEGIYREMLKEICNRAWTNVDYNPQKIKYEKYIPEEIIRVKVINAIFSLSCTE